MLLLVGFISKVILLFGCLIFLPAFLYFDVSYLLRLSLILALHQLFVGTIRSLTNNSLESISWLFELPLFALFLVVGYVGLPDFLIISYKMLLQLCGPLLLIFESYQIVNVVMGFSDLFVKKIHELEDDESTVFKGIIIGISLVSYGLFFFLLYTTYQSSLITPFLASYLSITATILILASLAVAFWLEEGVISDIAMISLFVTFIARNAVLESVPSVAASPGTTVQHVYLFDMLLSILALGAPRINISQFFTVDSVISTFLAIIALIAPFVTVFRTSQEPVVAKEPSKMLPIQQNFIGFFFVLLFTHVLLTCVGEISPAGTWFRIFQSVLTLGTYVYILKEQSDEGEKND